MLRIPHPFIAERDGFLLLSVCLKFTFANVWILCSIFAGCCFSCSHSATSTAAAVSLLLLACSYSTSHTTQHNTTQKKSCSFGFLLLCFFSLDYRTVLFLLLNVFFKHEHHSHARDYSYSVKH